MSRLKFDIKFRPQIESGKYTVQTRDGRPARIICWDRKGSDQPLVALVTTAIDFEQSFWVRADGIYEGTMGHDYDLFILTDEPELSEWEKEICGITNLNLSFSMTDEVKDAARRVLDLARKELEPEFDAAYKNQDEVVFRNGVKKGREEAMKDMPRWYHLENGAGGGAEYPVFLVRSSKGNYFLSNCIGPDTTYLNLFDLEKLPGLED